MKRSCHTCSQHTQQVIGKVISPFGRCTHIGWVRAGVMKVHPDGTQERKLVATPERPKGELQKELNKEGFYLFDLIDTKSNPRVCPHWNSSLRIAVEAMTYYGDSLEEITLPAPMPKPLTEWFERGCPLEDKQLKPLSGILKDTPEIKEVPYVNQLGWEPCVLCTSYSPALDEEGVPLITKGICDQVEETESRILGEQKQEPRTTYAFLSCEKHSINVDRTKEDPAEISTRLYPFVGINPLEHKDGIIQMLEGMYRFPTITRPIQFTDEDLERLSNMDFQKELRKRYKGVDHNQFSEDMGTKGATKFFAQRLRTGTVKQREEWDKFEHHKEAEELFKE